MPEIINRSAMQQEIAQIEQVLAQKRAALEQQGITPEQMPHPKESLREIITERAAPSTAIPPITVAPQTTGPANTNTGTPLYLLPEYKDQVQALITIAFSQSIDTAIKQVMATNNAALIDAFHDALVDELYNELVKQGKIQTM